MIYVFEIDDTFGAELHNNTRLSYDGEDHVLYVFGKNGGRIINPVYKGDIFVLNTDPLDIAKMESVKNIKCEMYKGDFKNGNQH